MGYKSNLNQNNLTRKSLRFSNYNITVHSIVAEHKVNHKRKRKSASKKVISPDPLECLFKKDIKGYNHNFTHVHIAKMLKNQNRVDSTFNLLYNLVEDGENMRWQILPWNTRILCLLRSLTGECCDRMWEVGQIAGFSSGESLPETPPLSVRASANLP